MNNNMKKCGLGPRSRIRQGIHINYIAVGCWLLAVGCHCQGHSPNLTKSESEAQSQSSARSTFAYEYEMQKHMVAAISMKINSTVIWESLNWSKQLRKFCVCGTELSISAQVDFAPLSVQFGTRIDDCCNCRFRSKIPFWPHRLRLIGQISFAWLQIVHGGSSSPRSPLTGRKFNVLAQ